MVELVGCDTRDCSRWRDVQPWAGMRPTTPTGRPILDRQTKGPSNLWLNAGHGDLAFTLAAGSAEILAQTIETIS